MLKILLKQISKRKNTGLKHLNDSKALIEYLNDMDDNYKNIEEFNPKFQTNKNFNKFRIIIHEILTLKTL